MIIFRNKMKVSIIKMNNKMTRMITMRKMSLDNMRPNRM